MANSEHNREQPAEFGEAVRLGHEPLTVSVKGLFIGTAGIVLLIVVSLALMYWLAIGLETREQVAERTVPLEWTQEDLPPAPHVQPNQNFELQQFTEANQKLLNSYGWIDQRQGIARIPVNRAIELLAERGLPTVQLDAADPNRDEVEELRGNSAMENSPPEWNER